VVGAPSTPSPTAFCGDTEGRSGSPAASPSSISIASLYQEYKAKRGLVDVDDMLLHLIRLLRDSERARLQVRERYRHVMVDEYQDTNVLQAEITRLLAQRGGNVMVVGDDAQSIYAFRGARFTNLHDFRKAFKGTKVITLEQNYRSTRAAGEGDRTLRAADEGAVRRLAPARPRPDTAHPPL
jgi:DNA helicase-2/ATP-dependent DNA helicase PcrA